MHRILLADSDSARACHLEGLLSDLEIKAVSVVSGEMAVAFSREYDLDLIVMDLSMGDARDALRLLREHEDTAQIPVVGIGRSEQESEWEGLCAFLDADQEGLELAHQLRDLLAGKKCGEKGEEDTVGATGEKLQEEPLEMLMHLSERILQQTQSLAGSADQFGSEGPEMFDFVAKSAEQMHRRLVDIAAHESDQEASRLSDREIRHDFRNILASVRGFTDLILMEEGIADPLVAGLQEIRECSKQFVEWLDAEKEAVKNEKIRD